MAKNSPEGPDKLPPEKKVVQGFWGNRIQFRNPETGQWAKRDTETGQIMEVKDEPYPRRCLGSIRGLVDQ